MSKVKITNVKVYKKVPEYTLTETSKGIRERTGIGQKMLFNIEASDLLDVRDLNQYKDRFKTEPNITVLLTYEEIEPEPEPIIVQAANN